ncbi:hypothetical protein O6H91_01G037000 [Diphasiastrum complanatum]|uniref:Uncharacterized protein n=1 Tax=Diphasiastrum complanatum TaxID=34168 RepID=A0ACC2EPZ2_DIPCM|nr:hypothetical protein O6H91_01G037000 [Diphasiastrum complanatum]
MQFVSTLAYAGTVTNLVVYLTDKLHESNASAASNVNNWTGAVYLCSLIGAFFGDAYWGRYLSSVIFLFIYFIGMVLSTISVSLHSLRPPDCASGSTTCRKTSTKQAGFFYFSIYVQALGCGAFQPCNTAFGADQFDEDDPKEHQGYKLGYSISTAALGLSLLLYIAGTPLYRYDKLGDNPFTRVFQVPIVAIRKYRVQVPQDVSLLYQAEEKQSRVLPHTSQFRFLDKAATMTNDEEKNPWQLCTVTQVEEVNIFFSTTYNQILTLFVEQGSAMDTRMGSIKIPASFFYDQAPEALRGIGSGLELSCFAMGSFLSSGLVSAVTSITKRGNNPGWILNNLNNGHLDYFYWLLVVLATLNFLLYLMAARWYRYTTFESVIAADL